MVESIAKGYKPWLIVCVLILLASLALLTASVGGYFFAFGTSAAPLWVNVTGALGVMGILASIAGLLALMAFAMLRAAREDRLRASTAAHAEGSPADSAQPDDSALPEDPAKPSQNP